MSCFLVGGESPFPLPLPLRTKVSERTSEGAELGSLASENKEHALLHKGQSRHLEFERFALTET